MRQYDDRERAAHERRTAAHTFKLGDILCLIWGCEQTNVDFCQVIAVPSSRSVTLRQLCAEVVEDGPGTMKGRKTPSWAVYEPGSNPSTHRATGPNSVSAGAGKAYCRVTRQVKSATLIPKGFFTNGGTHVLACAVECENS
ncbi:hypothetical protein [Paraburkholderia sp. HP33-1]|uniref:hypothetical protein n=1 Tax=Paraburkholderia sp. HP33-1 TaxID=2883243 RepID=UPI001F37BB1B|nr:hypothetical protein [Paraburkholderia sp. HP33-1]